MAARKPKDVVAEQSAAAPSEAAIPGGPVLCRVMHGSYLADRIYTAGETVLVPADELPKLLHCMHPVE